MFKKRRRRRKYRARKSMIQRFFRSFFAVVILSAFILGISLFVKEIAHLDPGKAAKLSGPILNKLGISPEEAGKVAGTFVERIFKTNIAPSETYVESALSDDSNTNTYREEIFRIALMSDAHNNEENLSKALMASSEKGAHSVFFLGDYTDFGVLENLSSAKQIMDESGLLYYSLPGDRDLYESVGPKNYYSVFGNPQISVSIGDTKIVLLDNSANYTLVDSDKSRQFTEELANADFVILAQPLYHPLASYGKPVMGLVKGEIISDVKKQAESILSEIQESNVKAIIAGDHHSFSRYKDKERLSLEHIVIGPVTDARAEQRKTSITVLSVFSDGSYSVEEIFFE